MACTERDQVIAVTGKPGLPKAGAASCCSLFQGVTKLADLPYFYPPAEAAGCGVEQGRQCEPQQCCLVGLSNVSLCDLPKVDRGKIEPISHKRVLANIEFK